MWLTDLNITLLLVGSDFIRDELKSAHCFFFFFLFVLVPCIPKASLLGQHKLKKSERGTNSKIFGLARLPAALPKLMQVPKGGVLQTVVSSERQRPLVP